MLCVCSTHSQPSPFLLCTTTQSQQGKCSDGWSFLIHHCLTFSDTASVLRACFYCIHSVWGGLTFYRNGEEKRKSTVRIGMFTNSNKREVFAWIASEPPLEGGLDVTFPATLCVGHRDGADEDEQPDKQERLHTCHPATWFALILLNVIKLPPQYFAEVLWCFQSNIYILSTAPNSNDICFDRT